MDSETWAALAAERDRLVARLEKGHAEYFAGFGSARSARLAREDPAGYYRTEEHWITLLRRYEATCDQLAALERHRTRPRRQLGGDWRGVAPLVGFYTGTEHHGGRHSPRTAGMRRSGACGRGSPQGPGGSMPPSAWPDPPMQSRESPLGAAQAEW